MSTLAGNKVRAIELKILKDYLEVFLEDGRIFLVPLSWYPSLLNASKKSLKNFRFIGKGLGIHWPDLDEDLSIDGFLSRQSEKSQIKKTVKPINKKFRLKVPA